MKQARINSEVLEDASHLLSSARLAIQELCDQLDVSARPYWNEKDEGKFWAFIDALPKHISDSVVN